MISFAREKAAIKALFAVPAALLCLALAAPSISRADDHHPQRTISITASGEVESVPDQVEITAGVTSDGDSAKQALDENSTAMSKIVDAMKDSGIAAKDLQTSDFSVQPVYDNPKDGEGPKVSGYRVNNAIHVTLHDTAKLGTILDRLVGLGANQINSISFGLDDPSAQEDEARKRAVKAARGKAELYAQAAGVKLGKVLTISEEEGGYQPYRSAAPRMEMAKAVPIEAGTTTTSIRVHVTWELE